MGTEGQGKAESKRARESETQWRLCDSNGPLVKSGEREQKKKRAGNHWWCMKKKVLERWTCLGRFKVHLQDTKIVSRETWGRKDRGQKKGGGQNRWMKVPGPAKYVSLSYMQAIYFLMVCQMEIKERLDFHYFLLCSLNRSHLSTSALAWSCHYTIPLRNKCSVHE